ncbi:hypothetical protein CDAR_382031 [Caerostris darwini]|uniref:Uncharacterized protein n=1 Tax=Caerostris darwini TaxID=1538125 RepID=A0AAV4V4R9_9ARAC|nr:hypothetical protein CDAR_382031 [Caerostris darwini]
MQIIICQKKEQATNREQLQKGRLQHPTPIPPGDPSLDFPFRPSNYTSNRKVCPGSLWASHRFKSKQGLGLQLKSSANGKRIRRFPCIKRRDINSQYWLAGMRVKSNGLFRIESAVC